MADKCIFMKPRTWCGVVWCGVVMVLLFNAMDKNERREQSSCFRHALPCVRATQKRVDVNISHALIWRVSPSFRNPRTNFLFALN
ncbi:hypothetical protein VNO77_21733 [Canavalia gladiata]|uniref:Uncharacterized protein n=1 Tax=Canavalia gladiata TaxID=3824 RepID=A0AAN9QDV8_CANGL